MTGRGHSSKRGTPSIVIPNPGSSFRTRHPVIPNVVRNLRSAVGDGPFLDNLEIRPETPCWEEGFGQ